MIEEVGLCCRFFQRGWLDMLTGHASVTAMWAHFMLFQFPFCICWDKFCKKGRQLSLSEGWWLKIRSRRRCHCWAHVPWHACFWDTWGQPGFWSLLKWHLASTPKPPIDTGTVCRVGRGVFEKQQAAPTGFVYQLWMHLTLHLWWSVAAQSPHDGGTKAFWGIHALLWLLRYLVFNPDFWREQHKSPDRKKKKKPRTKNKI